MTPSRTFRQHFTRSLLHLSVWFGLVALYVSANALGVLMSGVQWRIVG